MTSRPLPLLLGALGVGLIGLLAFYATSVWDTPYLYHYGVQNQFWHTRYRTNLLTGELQFWNDGAGRWGSQRPIEEYPGALSKRP